MPIGHMAFSPWLLSISRSIPTINCFNILPYELYNHTKLILANSSSAISQIKEAIKYSQIWSNLSNENSYKIFTNYKKMAPQVLGTVMPINGEKSNSSSAISQMKIVTKQRKEQ
jgi:hypothetical protein